MSDDLGFTMLVLTVGLVFLTTMLSRFVERFTKRSIVTKYPDRCDTKSGD